MPVRLTNNRTATVTCRDTNGDTFRATFRILPDGEFDQFRDGRADDDVVKAFLRLCVVRLDDLVDDDGTPLEFNRALLESALEFADIRLALVEAYMNGNAEARAGN